MLIQPPNFQDWKPVQDPWNAPERAWSTEDATARGVRAFVSQHGFSLIEIVLVCKSNNSVRSLVVFTLLDFIYYTTLHYIWSAGSKHEVRGKKTHQAARYFYSFYWHVQTLLLNQSHKYSWSQVFNHIYQFEIQMLFVVLDGILRGKIPPKL